VFLKCAHYSTDFGTRMVVFLLAITGAVIGRMYFLSVSVMCTLAT